MILLRHTIKLLSKFFLIYRKHNQLDSLTGNRQSIVLYQTHLSLNVTQPNNSRTAFSLILNLPFFKDLLILTGLVTPTTVDPLLHTPLNSLVLWSITSRSFKTLSLLLVAKQSLLLLVKLRSLYATFVPSWMK